MGSEGAIVIEKVLFFIALGTVLPMMHQSSLGTLLVVKGGPQVNLLWQTPAVPLFLPAVGHHHRLRHRAFRVPRCGPAYCREIEMHLLQPMGRGSCSVCSSVFRSSASAIWSPGGWVHAPGSQTLEALLLLAGNRLFLVPLPGLPVCQRRQPGRLFFVAGSAIMLAASRFATTGFLIGYDTGLGVDHGWNYFPSTPN